MYKVGDLVRVINFHHKFNDRISLVNEVTQNWFGDTIYGVDFIPNHVQWKNLEPVTYLTTKEFIKLVEGMGYDVRSNGNVIGIREGIKTISTVVTSRLNSVNTHFSVVIPTKLFKIISIYANTPLEVREEKEPLFTLELPDTTINRRFYNKSQNSYLFSTNDDHGVLYQTQFTQKEIDELKQGSHGELIKSLKQEPVE